MIAKRIALLREEMKKRNIDIYVVPTADFHQSEYVGDYFKCREYITGFTGSAGVAVITLAEAGLWTDGRYFVQAASQLAGTPVTLYRMGEENVPDIPAYLSEMLPEGGCLGFDGRVIGGAEGSKYEEIAAGKNARIYAQEDLIGIIWKDRPELSKEKAWLRALKYTGRSTAEKLSDIRTEMKKKGCSLQLISCLQDIAWILNVRGNDIAYVPVVLSYMAVREEGCVWFVQEEAITPEVSAYLQENGIERQDYFAFYPYMETIAETDKIWIDSGIFNYALCEKLPAGVKVYDAMLPSEWMRGIKNETEQANARIAHEKDAEAMIRFIYWLKTNVGKIPMTEISVSDQLEQFRRQQPGCLDISFSTIAGYQSHGAIVHYHALPEITFTLEPEGFILVDSGGHYEEGTTDITRTIALGPVTDEMKANFTRVCRATLALANARFRYGCTGQNLDILARTPLWEAGLDYNHGTGHGVGNLLSVHEGPQNIHWSRKRGKGAIFEAGMITSDEPGLYLEGQYGIRTENEILCRRGEKNAFGQFLYFENLTLVPIDLDAIDADMMSETEKKQLNDYHAYVYEKMAPKLPEEIRTWLAEYTRAI